MRGGCRHEYELVLLGPDGVTTVMTTAEEMQSARLDRPELSALRFEYAVWVVRD